MSLKFGTEHVLLITQVSIYGMGMGQIDGKIVLVPQTLPGDKVTVRMGRKKYGLKTAKLLTIEVASPYRKTASCSHFGSCGGCQILNVSYEEQLQLKDQMMLEGVSRLTPHLKECLRPIKGCEHSLGYRNKMEYAFGTDTSGRIFLGLKRRGCFDQVIPTPECQLLSSDVKDFFECIEKVLNEQEPAVTVWDYHKHCGVFRHLVIRQSKSEGRYFLNFIVSDMTCLSVLKAVVDALTSTQLPIQGIQVSLNDTVGDHTFFTESVCLFGDMYLHDKIGDLTFQISPISFFQTNSRQAKTLYDQIVALGEFTSEDVVLDLYCGIGTIGAYLSSYVHSVVGIEDVPKAIEDAEYNRQLNGIENMTFRASRVKNSLKFESFSPDVVIVDPPRSGMVPKALRRVLALEAPRLIYVSCNPANMLLDLAACEASGYQVMSIQPVDMFPNTMHLESVTLLKRITF